MADSLLEWAFMKIRVLRQRLNQILNLQKAFFVFSEVAENALVSSEVTKSVANWPLRIITADHIH